MNLTQQYCYYINKLWYLPFCVSLSAFLISILGFLFLYFWCFTKWSCNFVIIKIFTVATVVWHCAWGDKHQYVLSRDREPMIDKSLDITKVYLGESMSFMELLQRLRVIWRNRNKTALSPKLGDNSWKMKTWSSLHNL